MKKDKESNDIFLQSIGKVKPLIKTNKNYKQLTPLTFKNTKDDKETTKKKDPNIVKQTHDTKSKKKILKIESTLLKKKFKKGNVRVDKRIDFHGYSVEEARKIFLETIDDCFYSNKRCILYITGKGINKTNYDAPNVKLFHGKIRENFQKWIYEKEVISKILNVTPAGFPNGGDGAFFVYLRKNKP